MKYLYDNKNKKYFSEIRHDIIRLLPNNPEQKILEVGAAQGDSLVYIKQHRLASEVVGIDLFELPGTNQSNPQIDTFHINDIEKDDLNYLKPDYFDVIICGDVLEHLLDPWTVVRQLTNYLKTGGIIIASIPNIRHFSALSRIYLKGDFAYSSEGLLDKTHLRFFCKKNLISLFETNELKTIKCKSVLFNNKWNSPSKLLNRFTFKLFEEFLSIQYLLIAKKL